MHIEIGRIGFDAMLSLTAGVPSAAIRTRVEAARRRQLERYSGTGVLRTPAQHVRRYCPLGTQAAAICRVRAVSNPNTLPKRITYRSLERRGLAA